MIKKYRVITTAPIIMAMLGLLIWTSEGHAFFDRPAAVVTILSTYPLLHDKALPVSQVWKVVPEATAGGAAVLRFFPETESTAGSICEIILPPSGEEGEITWRGVGKSAEKRSSTGLLIIPGFPAPCDILPVEGAGEGRVYQEKSEVGGSVFSRSYRVDFAQYSFAEAQAQGWIKGAAPVSTGLVMVTVTDARGRLTVRQLWSAAGSWWLYEETPLRRSWLIY
jgi:hypothetical protein